MKVHELLNKIQFQENDKNEIVFESEFTYEIFVEEDVNDWFRIFEFLERDVKSFEDSIWGGYTHELKIFI